MENLNDIDINTSHSKMRLKNAINFVDSILANTDQKDVLNKELCTKFYDIVITGLIDGLSVLTESTDEIRQYSEYIKIISNALKLCDLIKLDLDNYMNCKS